MKKLDRICGFLPDQAKEKIEIKISKQGKFTGHMAGSDPFPSNYFYWEVDRDLRIIPGLIDIHVHGGKGITFGEHLFQVEDELRHYSSWAATNGVTGFLCSIAAPDQALLLEMVEAYARILGKDLPGAECLGLHLEGPYLSQARRGAFNSDWLRNPSLFELESLLRAGKGWIRQITIAPELDGADDVAEFLTHAGIVAALGHTDGDYDCIRRALSTRFSHVTHTFNAMSTFSHFAPGAIGAVLNSENASAELIADGIHAHPGAMQLIYKCLGPDRITLITDAMAGAGMPDGVYELIGSPVIVKDGKATRPDDGRLAGSTTTLNRCVFNMNRLVGVPFAQCIKMASQTPACVLHLDHRLGTFEAGKAANFVIVDQEIQIVQTVVNGQVVYDRSREIS